jgi:general stress protein 26
VRLFCRLFVFGCAALVAGLPAAAADRVDVLKVAREVARKARYATFVTIGEDGQPQVRIVDALGPDEDCNFWVGTNPLTRKVAEIAKNPRVTLTFFDPSLPAFVTLLGSESVVADPAVKAQHWKNGWSPFYKNEHRGADFALVRFVPRRLEIVSEEHGFVNAPGNWRPVSVEFPARPPTP